VIEVERPSKANAWNVFVHQASDQIADYLIFLDGDVQLLGCHALASLISALEDDSRARIAGARTVKHVAGRRSSNPLLPLSLGASEIRREMPGTFAGCLYCGRGEILRQFCLPTVLVGEDVFVRAMIVTDFFRSEDDPALVISVPDAQVGFEAYTTPLTVFRNLKRRALTLAIDAMLFDLLWAESTAVRHAGVLLLDLDREDPDWSDRWIRKEVRKRMWRVDAAFHFRKWFVRVGRLSHRRRVLLWPVAAAAGILDTLAEHAAFRDLRRGSVERGWFETKTEAFA
jgi:transposase